MRPLRLSVMEELFYWGNHPASPLNCFIRLYFTGGLKRETLEQALAAIMPKHPLLRSRIEQRGGRLYWMELADPTVEMDWRQGSVGQPLPNIRRFDMRQSAGIRLIVVEDADECELTIQFHHACCDGKGIFLWITDLLIAYAAAAGVEAKKLRPPEVDPTAIHTRNRYGLNTWKYLKMAPEVWRGIRGAKEFLERNVKPIVPHELGPLDGEPPIQYPALLEHTFTVQETRALRQSATAQDVTMNDVLMRRFFQSLNTFRQRRELPNDEWMRMMIPVSLRVKSERDFPAANILGSAFVDRKGTDCADSAALLRSLNRQMEYIKDHQLAFTFIFSMALKRMLPGGIKKSTHGSDCQLSCVFTNLGKVLSSRGLPKSGAEVDIGHAILKNVNVVAPLHPYTCFTLNANIYANRLNLTLHYDPRPISAADAEEMLELLISRATEPTLEKGSGLNGIKLAVSCCGPCVKRCCDSGAGN